MKKVYIPTPKDLRCMESVGIDIYSYLLNKTVESIIMVDIIYNKDDMFDIAYDTFYDYPEILYAIAKMYPEKIKDNKRARNDVDLCIKLIPNLKQQSTAIYGLDRIAQFSDTVLQNHDVINQVIRTLSKCIEYNPKYRFEYLEPNPILDKIFSGDIDIDLSKELFDSITFIEPAYYTKLKDKILKENKDLRSLYDIVIRNALRYSFRYGISINCYEQKEERIKKLYRRLETHKAKYHF